MNRTNHDNTEILKLIRLVREENERLRRQLEGITDPDAVWSCPEFPLLHLPRAERRVLRLLYEHDGRPVRLSAIFDMLYGALPETDVPQGTSIPAYISKLRKRFRGTSFKIVTHHSSGWSLQRGPPVEDQKLREIREIIRPYKSQSTGELVGEVTLLIRGEQLVAWERQMSALRMDILRMSARLVELEAKE